MPLSIKNQEAERLARDLAARTGRTITEAVIAALREQLKREQGRSAARRLKDELLEIGDHCASLPDLDVRSAEEILGYDEAGIPR